LPENSTYKINVVPYAWNV